MTTGRMRYHVAQGDNAMPSTVFELREVVALESETMRRKRVVIWGVKRDTHAPCTCDEAPEQWADCPHVVQEDGDMKIADAKLMDILTTYKEDGQCLN